MNSLLFVSELTWPTKLSALRLVRGSVQFDNKDNEEILKKSKKKSPSQEAKSIERSKKFKSKKLEEKK